MAGDITLALRTAQSGLLTNQTALNAVANNISNVNSVGYSRKIVNLEQRVVAGAGAGVQVSEITRRIDEGLLKSLRLQLSTFHALDVQGSYYARVQDLFGAPGDNTSIAHIFEDFTSAIETLAVSPDKTLEQSDVVRWGQNLTLKLRDMSTAVQELRLQADKAIADIVDRVNQLTDRIRSHNDEIISRGTVGIDVSDLKDQRDQAVDELATLIDIRYFSRSDGDVIVFTSAGRTLVDNQTNDLAHNPASSVTATTTHAEGDFNGLFVGSQITANDITNELIGGQLKGLVEMRDSVLPNLQSQLDHLAANLRDVFNQVHNRGAPFPGLQTMTGTRVFTEPGTQTIRLDPTGSADDVIIGLFDSSGNQSATISLNTLMTSASFGGAQASRGPWTINIVATKLQNWLQANGAATASVSAATGKFVINLNTTSRNLVFRDQTATADGSSIADAEIGFDADGSGSVDQTVNGFSYFFGLNDFFVDNLAKNIKESDVQSSSFSSAAGTWVFRDSSGAMTGSPLAIPSGSSLSSIATLINNNIPNASASVIPDGAGFRLRISHDQGSSFVLTQTAGTVLTTLGMHEADVNVAASITVRSNIIDSPSLVARGRAQWDPNLGVSGQYFMSIGDDTNVVALATAMTTNATFKQAGGLGAISTTFTEYASDVVARSANLASAQETSSEFAGSLTRSLQEKSDNVRGVNLDEEMATLIQFQQAYSAAARVVNVIQRMFEALDRAVA